MIMVICYDIHTQRYNYVATLIILECLETTSTLRIQRELAACSHQVVTWLEKCNFKEKYIYYK